jgi:hypothetical protein
LAWYWAYFPATYHLLVGSSSHAISVWAVGSIAIAVEDGSERYESEFVLSYASPIDPPGDIRPRRPDDSSHSPLWRSSSAEESSIYGDFREFLSKLIATPRPDRLNGGGGSPERTALPAQFPAIRD